MAYFSLLPAKFCRNHRVLAFQSQTRNTNIVEKVANLAGFLSDWISACEITRLYMRPLVRYRVKAHISIFDVSTFPIPRLLLRSCSAVAWPVVMVHYFPKKERIVVTKIQIGLTWTDISRFNAMETNNPAMQHAMAQLLKTITQVSW